MIYARVESCDGTQAAEFDATDYFEHARPDQLQALQACDFSYSEAADRVAAYMAGKIREVANVLQNRYGAECSIAADEAREWLRVHTND